MRQNVCANISQNFFLYYKVSVWQKVELYRQTDQFWTQLTWQNKIGNHQTVRVSLSLSGEKISRKVREQGGVRRGGGGYFKCDRENIQIRSVRSRWQPDPPQDLGPGAAYLIWWITHPLEPLAEICCCVYEDGVALQPFRLLGQQLSI